MRMLHRASVPWPRADWRQTRIVATILATGVLVAAILRADIRTAAWYAGATLVALVLVRAVQHRVATRPRSALGDSLTAADDLARELAIGRGLAQPVTYAGVSLLLMWRGIFVGKYLGLAGLISLPFTLSLTDPRTRSCLLAIALPAFAMAAVHAAVSVSIPRYNLALVPVYACSLAWLLAHFMPAGWRSTFDLGEA